MGVRLSKEIDVSKTAPNSEKHKKEDSIDDSNIEIPVRNSKRGKSLTSDKILPYEPSDQSQVEVLKILKEKNKEFADAQLIDSCLAKHFFIRNLERKSRAEIIREMSLASVPTNTIIFKQGDIGKYFYVIKSGEVIIDVNNKFSKTITAGESFGELALLHQSPRSATIKTLKDCQFWVLERKIFRKVIEHINYINFEENKKFIQCVPVLNMIENDLKTIICYNLLKEAYEEGNVIVKGRLY
jgi:cGMP-dependent protein kinase